MFGPKKKTLWLGHPPLASNSHPFQTFKNYSLGKEAKSLAIYMPLILPQENVKEVEKNKGMVPKGGKNLRLVKPNELEGKGKGSAIAAFQHPIKVVSNVCLFCLEPCKNS